MIQEHEIPTQNQGGRKVHIKGHKPQTANEIKDSQDNLMKTPNQSSDMRTLVQSEFVADPVPQKDERVVAPKKNNLIQSNPEERTDSRAPSIGHLPGHETNSHAGMSQVLRSGELPPVKSGKVPIRRTFKPPQVKEQDFEGM